MNYIKVNDAQVSLFCERVLESVNCEGTFSETVGKEYSYNSLVFCLIDAVFSIGVKYTSVEKAVEHYANYYKLERFEPSHRDRHRIEDFITNYERFKKEKDNPADSMAERVFNNRQKTSSRSGILKSEACYQVAIILRNNGINTLDDFQNLEPNDLEKLDKEIKKVKGQSSGIMFSYFCMLAGSDDMCKPDRWIKRFLKNNNLESLEEDNEAIQELFKHACDKLKHDYPEITVKYLDYQIWNYQKNTVSK